MSWEIFQFPCLQKFGNQKIKNTGDFNMFSGMVRKIDDLGRIVLPKEMRKTLGIEAGEPMEIGIVGDSIVLKKFSDESVCTNCGGTAVKTIGNVHLCAECLKKISE